MYDIAIYSLNINSLKARLLLSCFLAIRKGTADHIRSTVENSTTKINRTAKNCFRDSKRTLQNGVFYSGKRIHGMTCKTVTYQWA